MSFPGNIQRYILFAILLNTPEKTELRNVLTSPTFFFSSTVTDLTSTVSLSDSTFSPSFWFSSARPHLLHSHALRSNPCIVYCKHTRQPFTIWESGRFRVLVHVIGVKHRRLSVDENLISYHLIKELIPPWDLLTLSNNLPAHSCIIFPPHYGLMDVHFCGTNEPVQNVNLHHTTWDQGDKD